MTSTPSSSAQLAMAFSWITANRPSNRFGVEKTVRICQVP
jgi:hypothetical protein